MLAINLISFEVCLHHSPSQKPARSATAPVINVNCEKYVLGHEGFKSSLSVVFSNCFSEYFCERPHDRDYEH